jgi:hypothetical protein
MRPLPEIHFQVPSMQEGINHWACLDQDQSEITIDCGNGRISGHLSVTQQRALTLLLENSMAAVAYKNFDRHHGATMSQLRQVFSSAVVHGKIDQNLLIPEEMQQRMQGWLRGRDGSYVLAAQAYQGRNISRLDRLFRAFGSVLLGRPEMGASIDIPVQERPPIGRQYGSDEFCRDPELRTLIVPRKNLKPLLIFAAERALVKDGIRQILPPGEAIPPGWDPTLDDLTGDTVSVSLLSSHLAEFGFGFDAFAPTTAAEVLKDERAKLRPLLFVGSAYANTVLRDIENQSWRDYPYGARFDFEALRMKKGWRVSFESETCSGAWFEQHHMDRSRDIAVIRRWRTADGRDAIMAAGMTAQGTLGAVHFLCDERCVDEIFEYLAPDAFSQNEDDVEAMQFDVVIAVPLRGGIALNNPKKTVILAGAPRGGVLTKARLEAV